MYQFQRILSIIRQSFVRNGLVVSTEKIAKARSSGAEKLLATAPLKPSVAKKFKPLRRLTTVMGRPANSDSIFALVNLGLWDQTVHVREGLPAAFVAEMSDALAMPRANFLDNLQLPRSTIEARIKKKTPLTSAEGGAVLRSAKALARAEEVFEDHASAAAWFKREIRSLGGVTPVSLMDTDSGFELVMKTLGRIEYGVVA